MNRKTGRADGFTLVEMLIALVLIAVIVVLLFGGLRLGSRTWEGVERVSERLADVRTARNLIERLLRQTYDGRVIVDGVELRVFAGEAARIEWVAPLSEQVGVPGLYLLRLALEDAGEHPRLVLTRWLLHPDVLAGGDDYPAWEPLAEAGDAEDAGPLDRDLAAGAYGRTVLLPAVARFELAYFGISEGEQGGEWFEDWLDQPRLPERVRVALDSPERSWPAGIVMLPGATMPNQGGLTQP